MEKLEKIGYICKNQLYEGRIRYVENGNESFYYRQTYFECEKEKFRWVDQNGVYAPERLMPLFEEVASHPKFKLGKLKATIMHMSPYDNKRR